MYKTIDKYWGAEDWIMVTKDYAFKKLLINKGKILLNHYHKIKEETFYVSDGIGIITINGVKYNVKSGDSFHIPPGTRHSIKGITDLTIFEASTPYMEDRIRE